MNVFYVLVLYLSSVFSSCNLIDGKNISKNSYVRDEDYEKIADEVTRNFARKMKKEKGLQCIGTGGGMMTDIQRMAISFQVFQEVDLVQARELLVSTTIEYLNAINGSKEVRPYLHNYPFKQEDVGIMIWVQEPNGDDMPEGKINFMSASRGVLLYKVSNGGEGYSSREIHKETYEEALKIVDAEKKAS